MVITDQDMKKIMTEIIEFPRATVCKHYVVLKLLDMAGSTDVELIKSVIDGNDEKSIELLK